MDTKTVEIDIEKCLTRPLPVVESDEEWARTHAPMVAFVLATVALVGCGRRRRGCSGGCGQGWW